MIVVLTWEFLSAGELRCAVDLFDIAKPLVMAGSARALNDAAGGPGRAGDSRKLRPGRVSGSALCSARGRLPAGLRLVGRSGRWYSPVRTRGCAAGLAVS